MTRWNSKKLGPISRAMSMGRPLPKQGGPMTSPIKDIIDRKRTLIESTIISKTERRDACLLWTGRINREGYGQIKSEGRYWLVHRLAWAIANDREIPSQMQICHSCDVRNCVEPSHLWLGTGRDNMIDMYLKGRGASTQRRNGAVIAADLMPEYAFHKDRIG